VDETLTCDCGFIARAPDDVGLATEVRRHAWEAHRMPLTPDEALLGPAAGRGWNTLPYGRGHEHMAPSLHKAVIS
jgi:hypothetical protein